MNAKRSRIKFALALTTFFLVAVPATASAALTLEPATDFAVGINPLSIEIDDLNNDGRPDLAVATFGTDEVSVLLGTGTGTGSFGSATDFAVGITPTAVAKDLNDDGIPDLAVANQGSTSVSALFDDFDGDKYQDVATTGPYFGVKWVGNAW